MKIGTTNIDKLPLLSMNELASSNSLMNNDNLEDKNVIVDNKALEFKNIRDNELQNQQPQSQESKISEQKYLNKIVSDLQQASASGQTKLQIRDVPTSETHLVQDECSKISYLPNNNEDYIKENDDLENELNYNLIEKDNTNNKLDMLYEELSIPLMLFVLYFIFQLSYVNNLFFKYLNFLFNSSGNLKLEGYLIKSLLFVSIYYFLNKCQRYLSI